MVEQIYLKSDKGTSGKRSEVEYIDETKMMKRSALYFPISAT